MKALERRAEQVAAARQRAAIERIAEAMKPLGRLDVEQNRVRVSGRGLVRRWLADSSLRFIADLLK